MSNFQSIIYFIPEIIIIIAAIGFLLLTTFFKISDSKKYFLISVSLIISLIATLLSHSADGHGIFNNLLVWDSYGQFIKIFTLIIACIILIIRRKENCNEASPCPVTEFGIGLLLLISVAFVSINANHLVALFISLQILHLAGFFIVQSRNLSPRINTASWHDLMFDIFTSLIMLMGIALIYDTTGTFFIAEIGQILSTVTRMNFPLILGIALLLVGFSFTITGIYRLSWKLEILRTISASDRLLLLTIPQFIETTTLIRLLRVGLGLVSDWRPLTLMIGIFTVLTLLYPIIWLIKLRSAKDIIIVTSIAQSGFGLLALCAGNISGDVAALFYQVVLIFSLIAFTIGEILMINAKSSQLIALASLIGIPLTAGFPAKYLVFISLVQHSPFYYFLIVIGIGSAALMLIGYVRIVRQIITAQGQFFNSPQKGSQLIFFIQILINIILISIGFYWTPLTDYLQSIMTFCVP
ncbi:MAG: hypothetical protein KBG36_06900 [Candidatus Marinimicrobia bacterium]|nr:hypothetical protein [Candidatus Neomarinimicrobiota bacterium]